MKYWIVIIAALFLASCKTKAGMVNTNSVTPYVVDENELTSKKVIENPSEQVLQLYSYHSALCFQSSAVLHFDSNLLV